MQLAMSGDTRQGIFDAKSGANRRDVFVRPTSSRAAYVAEARWNMIFRVASGNPWL